MYELTDISKATILLCSHFALTDRRCKPYTPLQWSKLRKEIYNSEVRTPDKLFGLSAKQIADQLKVSHEEAERIEGLLARGTNMAIALDQLAQKGIYVVTRSDAAYPSSLLHSLPPAKVPPVLFYCGDLSLAETPGIAIVGSRNVDYEGEQETRFLAKCAAENQLAVYSGGARGVDGIAADAALAAGGKTIAFLADSLERRIRMRQVREAVNNGKMLLLSARIPTASFQVGAAMERNKYVYALSKGACVIASDKNKGGTWAGATESLKEGYAPVYVWNTARYPGNQALIQQGGIPFEKELNWGKLEEKQPLRIQPESYSLFAPAAESAENAPEKEQGTFEIQKNIEVVSEAKADNMAVKSSSDPIFEAVWPLLEKILRQFDQENDILAQSGNRLVKKQLHIWLETAQEQGLVKRKTHPIRYELQ